MNDDVEAQPNGEHIEQTLDVVPNILFDEEFAEEVRVQNGFPEGIGRETVAILFLTGRFHSAVKLLSLQVSTLKRELDGLATQLADRDVVSE